MTKKNKLQGIFEDHDDQKFQELTDYMEGIEGQKEFKLPGEDPPEHVLSHWTEELDKQERCARRKTPSYKRAVRVAMLAAFLLSALLISVNAGLILNWLSTTFEKYTSLQQETSLEAVIEGWKGYFIPKSIPAGYSITDAISGQDVKIIEYADAEGHQIVFYQYDPNSNIFIDTEAASKTLTSAVTDHTAYLFQKRDLFTLYWDNGTQVFSIDYFARCLTEQQVIQMANSLQQN